MVVVGKAIYVEPKPTEVIVVGSILQKPTIQAKPQQVIVIGQEPAVDPKPMEKPQEVFVVGLPQSNASRDEAHPQPKVYLVGGVN